MDYTPLHIGRLNIVYALFTALCTLFLFVPEGASLTYDSKQYLTAAYSFAQNGSFTGLDSIPLVTWPPGFSFYLFVLGNSSVGIIIGNSLLAAANTLLATSLFQSTTSDKYLKQGFFLLISTSAALIQNFYFVWADGLFTLLLTALCWFMLSYLQTNKNIFLIVVYSIVALLPLTKYIGILLPFIVTFIIITQKVLSKKYSSALLPVGLFSISLVPFALLIYRNFRHTGTLMGIRPDGTIPAKTIVLESATAISNYFVPAQYFQSPALSVLVLTTLLFVSGRIVFNLYRNNHEQLYFAGFLFLFTLTFISSIIYSAITNHSDFDERIYSPLVFPLLYFGLITFDKLSKLFPNKAIIYTLLAIFLLFPITRNIKNIVDLKSNADTYESAAEYCTNLEKQ